MRVAVDGGEEHVVAGVENRLGAIAVVVIHIEDRDFAMALVEERLGGNGCVIEIAITAHEVGGGVVSGRAAQGKRTVGTVLDRLLRGERHLRRAVRRLPGAGGDRRAAVEAVIAQLPVQAGGHYLAQRAGGPGVGQQVALLTRQGPACPRAFEEFQVRRVMNACQRRQAKVVGRLHWAEFALLDSLQYMVGAGGHFETGHQLPIHQFAAAVVQVMIVRVDRQHVVVLAG